MKQIVQVSILVVSNIIFAIAGYQFYGYQQKQEMKSFFNAQNTSNIAASPNDFFDIGTAKKQEK